MGVDRQQLIPKDRQQLIPKDRHQLIPKDRQQLLGKTLFLKVWIKKNLLGGAVFLYHTEVLAKWVHGFTFYGLYLLSLGLVY